MIQLIIKRGYLYRGFLIWIKCYYKYEDTKIGFNKVDIFINNLISNLKYYRTLSIFITLKVGFNFSQEINILKNKLKGRWATIFRNQFIVRI